MGPFETIDCTDTQDCGLNHSCCLVDLFSRAEAALLGVYDSVTLEQLARLSLRRNGHRRLDLVLERSPTP
jgi:hypothetical protein